jgi:hypothetical protein
VNVDAGELPLQSLEQRHEIPDGEDVMLHENAYVFYTAERLVDRMREDLLPL